MKTHKTQPQFGLTWYESHTCAERMNELRRAESRRSSTSSNIIEDVVLREETKAAALLERHEVEMGEWRHAVLVTDSWLRWGGLRGRTVWRGREREGRGFLNVKLVFIAGLLRVPRWWNPIVLRWLLLFWRRFPRTCFPWFALQHKTKTRINKQTNSENSYISSGEVLIGVIFRIIH